MKYRSKLGTVINIPDGLTPKQIADIKADADAGYGTRAQQTANRLGKKAKAPKPAEPAPAAPAETPAAPAAPQRDPNFNAKGYLSANPDIAAEAQRLRAEGDTRTAEQIAFDHYRDNGRAEGRGFGEGQGPQVNIPGAGTGDTVNAGPPPALTPDGQVDRAAEEERLKALRDEDTLRQFKLDNPDQTDEFGNTITYSLGPDGKVIRTVKAGETAEKFRKLALAAAEGYDPAADRAKAEEATYGTLTKYYDRDMSRENEAAKQELANRGIPYDPAAAQDSNSANLYGRTIGGISEKYRSLKDDASRQAILAGNEAFRTTASARDSFIKTASEGANTFGADFRDYINNVRAQTGDDTIALLSLTAEQYAKLKGISVEEAAAAKNRALEEEKLKEAKRANRAAEDIQRAAAARSGGGGGGGSDDGGGFELLG
jgi:hypothetical protein